MNTKDSLGDRMKSFYEDAYRFYLPRRMPVMIRCDGKSFHSLTQDMKKPFDKNFIDSIIHTTLYLCENVQNCVFGYCQSDEISLVLINYKRLDTESWFDNNLQKMVSISSAMATLAFNKKIKDYYPDKEGVFDARAWVVPKEEVNNGLLWRMRDCTRNSVQSLARAHFSHKSLHELNNAQIQDKLMLEKGINWNDLPTHLKRGTAVIKKDGAWAVDKEPPIFSQDPNYINRLLEPEEV